MPILRLFRLIIEIICGSLLFMAAADLKMELTWLSRLMLFLHHVAGIEHNVGSKNYFHYFLIVD